MKPEGEKPSRPAAKPATTNNDEKASRPRPNRPAGDKRPSKPRGNRQDNRQEKDSATNRSKAPKAEAPSKMGTLGALLQEAGVTKTKK